MTSLLGKHIILFLITLYIYQRVHAFKYINTSDATDSGSAGVRISDIRQAQTGAPDIRQPDIWLRNCDVCDSIPVNPVIVLFCSEALLDTYHNA